MTAGQEVPASERLRELIRRMAGQPVVVLADLVVDRFITGTPKRISREAPVLILSHEDERSIPGGGANAVANIAALGGQPLPLGVIGDDDSGRSLVAAFAERGIDTGGIRRRDDYRTPTKVRILGGARGTVKQQIVRYDIEDRAELGADDFEHFRRALAGWPSAPVAVVSDYGYGAAAPAVAAALAGRLAAEGGPVLVDSRYRLAEFAPLDGATPNEEEAEALLADGGGRTDGASPVRLPEDPTELDRAGHRLSARLGARFLLVTRGGRGMSLFAAGSPSAHLPVHGTDQVADVTGAGDTVIGTFALALAAGATPLEAAALANYAGGVVVMKMGTATVSPAELDHAVASDPRPLEELLWASS